MGRIDALRLEQAQKVELVQLLRSHGVMLARSGEDLVGRCPLGNHETTTSTLRVTPETGRFLCSECGAAGSSVDWVMKAQGVSLGRAVEMLLAHDGDVPGPGGDVTTRSVSPFPSDVDDQQLLDLVADFYHKQLPHHRGALAYLAERRIDHPDVVSEFRIGVADRTLGYHLGPSALKAGREIRLRLRKLGVLRDTGHERLRGCVTIPVLNGAGHVVSIYGCRISKTQGAAAGLGAEHWCQPTAQRGVFNLANGIRGQETVTLCESVLDALTFYSVGVHNVTCTYDLEGSMEEPLRALKEQRVRRVQIAFGAGEDGDRVSLEVAGKLRAEGMECFRVKLPSRLSVNQLAQQAGSPSVTLGLLLKAAEWLGQDPTRGVTGDSGQAQPPSKGTPQAGERLVPTAEAITAVQPTLQLVMQPPSGPLPAANSGDVDVDAEEQHFTRGSRKYRVRGLAGNTSLMVMKVNITVRSDAGLFIDTLDLLTSRARGHFITMSSVELGIDEAIVKADVATVLERLEAIQDARLQKLLKKPEHISHSMTAEDRAAAMHFLKDPRLMERVIDDLGAVGLVGERTNKALAYVAAVSRKLQKPLAIIIQSRPGGGKSALMDAVLSLMPEEDVVKYSSITGQALYYMGTSSLRHKILAVAEDQGAEKAAYPLKILQSDGELTIASTGKDPRSGRHETKSYRVAGPVMVLATTTASEIDDEFLSRCLVLSVDESREQTRAIHMAQKSALTRDGIVSHGDQLRVSRLHRNAQRLLEPLAVENPYAMRLSFPDHAMRTRRDFQKYTSLIAAITLLHQHQRETKSIAAEQGGVIKAVTTTVDDIRMANDLVSKVLGQNLDEIQGQTRRLLQMVQAMRSDACLADGVAHADFRFTQRQAREYTGWGNTQMKAHLARLVDRELLVVHRSGPGQRHFYEVCCDEQTSTDGPVLAGLTNLDALGGDSNTAAVGGASGPGRGDVSLATARNTGGPHVRRTLIGMVDQGISPK